MLIFLTLTTLLIHGYHPLAEDGGLYVAGIEYLLNPALFPHDTAFVTAHLHYSIFAITIAEVMRITHIPLAWVLLLAYGFSLWLTLYAGLQILRRCFDNATAQFAGIALLATWATLPVAGTSLLLIDPYLTARSFSTPLSLLAIAFALDDWSSLNRLPSIQRPLGLVRRPAVACAICLLIAALFHPLMAIYAIAMVLTLRILRLEKPLVGLCLLAVFAIAAAMVLQSLAPPDPLSVTAAAISRYYWFLSQWHWYELCGLIGPPCILLLILREKESTPTAQLCKASLALSSLAVLMALLFAHERSSSHFIARLQPLRGFLLTYALMPLLLGASLAQRFIKRPIQLFAPVFAAVLFISAGTLFYVQRVTFPASQHIELPWTPPANPWSRAFRWSSRNTPTDALFALDANYITTPGEDAQAFRATSLRSSLADFSKDGGEASITPTLSDLWQQGVKAQANLSAQSDTERDDNLEPLGVTWMVLHADSLTVHVCPYNNGVVKVCSLAH
jgi:hypothetical protein